MKLRHVKMLKNAPISIASSIKAAQSQFSYEQDYEVGLLSGGEQCVWAEIDGVVAGAMLWVEKDLGRCWWIDFTFVAAKHQGNGVYLKMRSLLMKLAKKSRARRIESHVGVTNKRMYDLMLKVGSRPVATHFYMEVRNGERRSRRIC